MIIVLVVTVLVALCGGGIALAEVRDRPVRRAYRAAQAASQN
jgi:hypothetical protein